MSHELLAKLEREIDKHADTSVFLDSYQRLNFTGFRKITKKCDKHNKTSSACWYMARLTKEIFMNLDFAYLLQLLSVCYEELRTEQLRLLQSSSPQHFLGSPKSSLFLLPSLVVGDDSPGNSMRPPSAGFEGDTHDEVSTKYLVQADDVMRVKVLIIKQVQISAVGGWPCDQAKLRLDLQDPVTRLTQGAAIRLDADAKNVASSVGTCLVHLDSHDFREYETALTRSKPVGGVDTSHSSNVSVLCSTRRPLRLRWDGYNVGDSEQRMVLERIALPESALDTAELIDIPENEKYVEGSVAPLQSVVLRQKYIPLLLDGTLDVDEWKYEMTSDVDKEMATHLLEKAEFLRDVMAQIQLEDLRPVMQSWFHRTSFRCDATTTPIVSINIDENLRYISERREIEGGNWCTFTTAAFATERVKHFPFAVLDIACPTSIHSKFLRDVTGLSSVTEVWGFSNFLHGVALLHRSEAPRLPHWFNFSNLTDLTSSTDAGSGPGQSNRNQSDGDRASLSSDTFGSPAIRVDVIREDAPSKISLEQVANFIFEDSDDEGEVPATIGRGPLLSTSFRGDFSMSDSQRVMASGPRAPLLQNTTNNIFSDVASHGVSAVSSVQGDLTLPVVGGDVRAGFGQLHGLDARSLNFLQRTPTPSPNSSVWDGSRSFLGCVIPTRRNVVAFFSGVFGWQTSEQDTVVGVVPPSGAVTVRVEPKAFFANERTLLQWMNTAVLIATIAITLLNFGTPSGRVAGLILSPVALFFIVYPFLVYLRRSRCLERKEPIDYNDRVGPTLLVVSLVVALSTVIALNIVDGHKKA
eukprot:Lankesteria_metandrocarpae@DN4258_c0_g1_i1.p1